MIFFHSWRSTWLTTAYSKSNKKDLIQKDRVFSFCFLNLCVGESRDSKVFHIEKQADYIAAGEEVAVLFVIFLHKESRGIGRREAEFDGFYILAKGLDDLVWCRFS